MAKGEGGGIIKLLHPVSLAGLDRCSILEWKAQEEAPGETGLSAAQVGTHPGGIVTFRSTLSA